MLKIAESRKSTRSTKAPLALLVLIDRYPDVNAKIVYFTFPRSGRNDQIWPLQGQAPKPFKLSLLGLIFPVGNFQSQTGASVKVGSPVKSCPA